MENLGQISQHTKSSSRFYVNHHLVILDLTSHGVEVRADCLCAIDSFLSNSQPISQFINLFLLKVHQLQVKPENKKNKKFLIKLSFREKQHKLQCYVPFNYIQNYTYAFFSFAV